MKTLNFDMNALRTMVIGVDLGGFSHAALRLNRSPSAVSMQLRKLERQAGQCLFQRSGRGLVLTQAGELLLQHARRVLALNDEMGQALGAINDGGTVRVGISQDFADSILQNLLSRYARVRPATHVDFARRQISGKPVGEPQGPVSQSRWQTLPPICRPSTPRDPSRTLALPGDRRSTWAKRDWQCRVYWALPSATAQGSPGTN
jgi:Bacterial regulatory helix-turn-helix protein, lysR family